MRESEEVLLSVIKQIEDLKRADGVEPVQATLLELSRMLPRPWTPSMIREAAIELANAGKLRTGNTINDLYYAMPNMDTE